MQRGGAKDLALHLLKEENDHAELHQLRGFAADTLMGALMETYAISRGTKAKQPFFSLSLNPPPKANVPTKDFEDAIERIENKLGLTGQPRAIVFHEKNGRRHAHAVWSRIDGERMIAIPMSHSGLKLMDVSRELHRDHGWTMPRGLADRSQCDPLNFSLEEWQQAKRIGRDPRDIKTAIQDAWAISDSKPALTNALAERGFQLARGDRRGFVAVDYHGEAYPLRSWADVKTKDLRERIGKEADCQSVDDAKNQIATGMLAKMQGFQRELDEKARREREAFEQQRKVLVEGQRTERAALSALQQERQATENLERQARFRGGFKGLWDRMRGEHRRTMELNMREAQQGASRDQANKDRVIQEQLSARRELVQARTSQRDALNDARREVRADNQIYRDMQKEWRTKAHPPTAPTKNTERSVSKKRKAVDRPAPPEQKAATPTPEPVQSHQRKLGAAVKEPLRVAPDVDKRRDEYRQQRRNSPEQNVALETAQQPSTLKHDFDVAKDARREAFREKRTRSEGERPRRSRGPTIER